MAVQALVEGDGGGEAGDEGVDGFTEAAAPGLVGLVGAHGFARDLLIERHGSVPAIITGLPVMAVLWVVGIFICAKDG
ncbi:hypothetical protein GCM10008969_31190 [Pseudomonas veronii subsp. inensis]